MTDPAPISWRCEGADTPEGCPWVNRGSTDTQRMNDASQHWIGYGWPHVVRPVRLAPGPPVSATQHHAAERNPE